MVGFSLDSPNRISVTSFMFALSKFIVDMIYDRGLEERIKKTKRDIYIRQARHSITALHEVNFSDLSTTHCHILSLSTQLSELISCSTSLTITSIQKDRKALMLPLLDVRNNRGNVDYQFNSSPLNRILETLSHNLIQMENE